MALRPGLINLFGNSSNICFNSIDGSNCIIPPDTYITAVDNLTAHTKDQNQLDIIDGSLVVFPSNSTEILDIAWVLNYTGNNIVEQEVYYQFSPDGVTWSGNWIKSDQNLTGGYPLDHVNYTTNLDVRDMLGYIRIKVFSFEIPMGGASDIEETRDPIPVGLARAASIKIS